MSVVNVTLGDGKKLNLPLGRQGENEVTAVAFDFSAWSTEFGSGTLSLSVQRHGDELPYAVTMTTAGTVATWTISDLDTAYKGTGEAQVKYTVGTKVKKSAVYKFTVNKSLGQNGEYPSPGQTWQQEIEADIADVKQDLQNAGMSDELKLAFYDCISHIGAWTDEHGQEYVDTLYDALFPVTPPATLTSITCVYTQSGTVYDTDSLDSLKADLVVTAHYSDGSSNTVTTYILSGTLAVGTSTIVVSYNGKTTTFDVTVTKYYQWEFDIDDVSVVNGAIAYSEEYGGHYNTNSTYSKNRRTFMLDSGDVAMPHYTDASTPIAGDKYPIPIPPTAQKVTASILANTQYLSLSTWNLDENNHYIRDASGTWEQGTSVATFTAGAFTYLTVLAKVNSAGGNYSTSTEPTGISIVFE